MQKLTFEISMSLDGLIAGPNPSLENPLGEGGEQLHEWGVRLAAWREAHGLAGGERNADSSLMEESQARAGAVVMGRKMFSGGEGPWDQDPNADGWWGEEPPFRVPVFVLTHHERDPVAKEGGTTFVFVTDGPETALQQAREAAGDKDVAIGGGADVARQYLSAGLLDELLIHLIPVFLGGGVRLFEPLESGGVELEQTQAIESPSGVAHLTYRVVK